MKRDPETGHLVKVVKRLEVLPKQARMVACTARMAAARGGTGSGKTYAWAIWLWNRIQKYPKANHVVIADNYEQLRGGFFLTFVGILNKIGWVEGEDYRYVESGAPVIHFPRLGRRVRLRAASARVAQRLRSTEFQSVVCEELPTWNNGEEVFGVLVGRLRHSETSGIEYGTDLEPQLRASFNPPAEGSWVHELITEKWTKEGFPCWRLSVRDNYLLLHVDPNYVKNLELTWNPRRHPSEIDGHWSVGGGNVYYGYNPDVHCNPPPGIPALDAIDLNVPLLWTHDFNVSMMCSIIAQRWDQPKILLPRINPEDADHYEIPAPSWQDFVLRALDEFSLPDSSSQQVVQAFIDSPWANVAREIQERTGKHGVELYGDVSGGTRVQTADSRGADRRAWTSITSRLDAAGIRYKCCWGRVNPPVKTRVEDVNDQFETGRGPGTTINKAKCTQFTYDLRELKWKDNGKDLDKIAGKVGDASDAWGYLVTRQRAGTSMWSFGVVKKS